MTPPLSPRRPAAIACAALSLCAALALALPAAALAQSAQKAPQKATQKTTQKAAQKTASKARQKAGQKSAATKAGAKKAAPPKPAAREKKPAAAPAPAVTAPAAAAAPAASAPATAAAPARPREADYIVAVVNTEPVTNYEVRAGMARMQRQLAERRLPAPSESELRTEVLERLISERAQLQYAREMALGVDDTALAQAELSIARQNQLATVPELHQRLQAEGLDVAAFREDLRKQVLLARLREREIEPRLRITDAEVDAFIRKQTGASDQASQSLNLAMILIAVPENASAEDTARLQARADQAMTRIRSGEDFAQVAREYSDANRRGEDGGELGLRPVERYPELFVASTRALRVGESAGPVKSDAGFHILKVLERKQNTELPEVRIPQTRVSHILLTTGPSQSQEVALQRAGDFRRRIAAGQATFEELARQHSQDASAADGGALGWAMPGQFVPEFEQAMNNLDSGQVSEPVVSRFGVHLIRVEDRREHLLSPDEQRALARNMLREEKAQEAFETWAREVRGRAYVEYRDPPQ